MCVCACWGGGRRCWVKSLCHTKRKMDYTTTWEWTPGLAGGCGAEVACAARRLMSLILSRSRVIINSIIGSESGNTPNLKQMCY